MSEFVLDPRLSVETVFISDWRLCRVLLRNERRFPWLVLVPRREGAAEIFDLNESERTSLMVEMNKAAVRLKEWAKADKMNVATLGNQVPQLHVHVVARRIGDAAWPNPPFGRAAAYDEAALARVTAELKCALQS
ncbi:MAG: HIT domain-containing protein [Alphaproteobacteria bacterium]